MGLGWDALEARIRGCEACGLCRRRKQAVPGVGDRQADWLFVGEGPGAEEDERGEPFVGQAGRLLDAMLASIDLKRGEDVYCQCRQVPPAQQSHPEAAELAACFPICNARLR
jgi:DNA polymerase